MSVESDKHIEDSLAKVRTIYQKASARIEALKPGEKVPATKLAEDLAKEIGMTGPQLYPTLLFLFKNYPGVEVRKGAHGGIAKVAPPVALAPAAVAKVEHDVTSLLDDKETAPIVNT